MLQVEGRARTGACLVCLSNSQCRASKARTVEGRGQLLSAPQTTESTLVFMLQVEKHREVSGRVSLSDLKGDLQLLL